MKKLIITTTETKFYNEANTNHHHHRHIRLYNSCQNATKHRAMQHVYTHH